MESTGETEEGRDGCGEDGREVWTPISLWNISVGSSSLSSSSSCWIRTPFVSGISETKPSSLVISFSRLALAVEARSRRDLVRDLTIGVTRRVSVP